MPEINLPDVSLQWSSAGDILKPSDAKIQQGWQVEIPPRQWFNWLDNRQDEAIAHIAQHGIASWSPTIEYQANKSYVQGSDGLVYKAITTHININPVGGVAGNWQSAFLTADQAVQVATAAQSRAMTANNVYLSPLQLANAFTGTNQTLSTNGFQRLPGGLILQWFTATITNGNTQTVPLPIPFSSTTLFAGAGQITEDTGSYFFCQVTGSTASNLTVAVYGAAPGAAPNTANNQSVKFLVVGF